MDAIGCVGAVVGLVFNFSKAIKTCHDIREGYQNVDGSISSMEHELGTLQGALKHLVSLMVNDAAALSSRWDEDFSLSRTFSSAMAGIERMILVLRKELRGYHSALKAGGQEMGVKKKMGFLWNQGIFKEHLLQLRSQAGALNFLLTVLQTGSMSDVKNEMLDLKDAIFKLSVVASVPTKVSSITVVDSGGPEINLLDAEEDLMDFEGEHLSPLSYGEELRRALSPVPDGGALKRSKMPEFVVERSGEVIASENPRLLTATTEVTMVEEGRGSQGTLSVIEESRIIGERDQGLQSNLMSSIEESKSIHLDHHRSEDNDLNRDPTELSPSGDAEVNLTERATRISQIRQAASKRKKPSEIMRAVTRGDLQAVTELLKAGHSIKDCHPGRGLTCLGLAASAGDFEMLELLLDGGADISAVDVMCRSALHYAAMNRHPECAELLLLHGAAPDARDVDLNTPLHLAAQNSRTEVIIVLQKWNKSTLQMTNRYRQTPLHLAAESGDLKPLDALCQATRKVVHVSTCILIDDQDHISCECPVVYEGTDRENAWGHTALQIVMLGGEMEAISLLLPYTKNGENAPTNIKRWSCRKLPAQGSCQWQRPLHHAVRQTGTPLLKLLLEDGADVKLLDSKGQSPLEIAIDIPNIPAVGLLLANYGCDASNLRKSFTNHLKNILTKFTVSEFEQILLPNLRLTEETSPFRCLLATAVDTGMTEKVKLILEKSGLTKNKIAKVLDEISAVENAILIDGPSVRLPLVELLLDFGAKLCIPPKQEDAAPRCALIWAAEQNDVHLAMMLMNRGGRLDCQSNKAGWPFHYAVVYGNDYSIRWFYNATMTAITASNPSKEQALEREKSLIEMALRFAVRYDSLKNLKTVRGLSSPFANGSKTMLLHAAVAYGRVNITSYLLDEGFYPLAKDKRGMTALDDEFEFISIETPDYGGKTNTKAGFEKCREMLRQEAQGLKKPQPLPAPKKAKETNNQKSPAEKKRGRKL